MASDYQLKRHTELWENQNKQIRRIMFFGLIFAYILLVNILQPYAERIGSMNKQLDELDENINSIEASIHDLNKLEDTLSTVQISIRNQPWRAEKEKLIRKYRQMNFAGTPTWDQYQKEADSTVTKIGRMVLNQVGKPFDEFLADKSFKNSFSELAGELTILPDVIKDWTADNLGRKWYLTLDQKEATVQSLTSELDQHVSNISAKINELEPKIEFRKDSLSRRTEALKIEIIEEEKKMPEKLDGEMQKILPNWISGIVTLKQMMLYPFLIIGIVIYAIVIAFELTRHYDGMIHDQNISTDDASEGKVSSLWTLNYSGRWDTLKTVLVYAGFILVMWYFYEKGFVIFKDWQQTEVNRLMGEFSTSLALWAGRILLFMLLFLVMRKPYKGFSN